jgi:hypothetical protein
MLLWEEREGERREINNILLSLSLSSTKRVEERGCANQYSELCNNAPPGENVLSSHGVSFKQTGYHKLNSLLVELVSNKYLTAALISASEQVVQAPRGG